MKGQKIYYMKKILNNTADFLFRNKAYFLAAFVPAAILMIAYAVFGVYPFGQRSVLALDLNAQYVSYFEYMYDVFAGEESIFYSWSRSFSGEFFGLFAYYLASPFNFIVWIFPRESITEGLVVMILAKCAACGLAASFYLKKKRNFSDYTTILFSMMYALSGYFTAQSINPMWLDGMIALPFIVMGVELACDKQRILPYVIPLLYIFYANYYIGFMCGIFSALYFLYYMICGRSNVRGYKEIAGAIGVYGFSSVAAILMSCPLIIPVYKSLSLGKLSDPDPDYSFVENFRLADMLEKLFPATYDTIRPEGMPMIYCGTLALIFAVLYFACGRVQLRTRISSGVLLGTLTLSMFVKPVDMMWHGGQVPVWMPYRYSFCVIFLLVIFSAEAFEKRNELKTKNLGAVFAALLGTLVFVDYSEDDLTVLIPIIFLAVTATVCASIVTAKDNQAKRIVSSFILAGVVGLELFVNTDVTFNNAHEDIYYSSRSSYADVIPKTRDVVDSVKEMDSGFYRMEKTYHRTVNDPLSTGLYGVSHSSSTYNAKVLAAMKKLGYGARDHYSRYDGATLLTDDIFGIKYVLSKNDATVPYNNRVLTNDEISVFKNDDALPLAFLTDLDVIGSRLDNSSPFDAQESLVRSMTGGTEQFYYQITDYMFDCRNINIGSTTDDHISYKRRNSGEEAYVSYEVVMPHAGAAYMYLPTNYERECALYVNGTYLKNYFENENHSIVYLGTYDAEETFTVQLTLYKDDLYIEDVLFCWLDIDALDNFNQKISELNSDTQLERTGTAKLEITVNAEDDCALFASIPLEGGWSVLIDGEEADILPSADDTFMCVRVPEGEHTIILSFIPNGLISGILFGFVGVIILALLIIAMRIVNKSQNLIMEEDNGQSEL